MIIDLEQYDELSEMENILKYYLDELWEETNLSETKLVFTERKYNTLYILTIITILYKEQQINKYIEQKTKDTAYYTDFRIINNQIDYIIEILLYALNEKDLIYATDIIIQYGIIIEETIKKFYSRKEKNYIQKEQAMRLIVEQKKEKQLMQLNPFAINQILQYKFIPMSTEEKIICDILEFYRIAALNITNQGKALIYVKQLLEKNYEPKQLEHAIIFIIGNVYQEAAERKINELFNELRPIIENQKITNNQIKEYFLSNNNFSNKILAAFILLTAQIEYGRLEQLEKAGSYQYIKNRQKNNP